MCKTCAYNFVFINHCHGWLIRDCGRETRTNNVLWHLNISRTDRQNSRDTLLERTHIYGASNNVGISETQNNQLFVRDLSKISNSLFACYYKPATFRLFIIFFFLLITAGFNNIHLLFLTQFVWSLRRNSISSKQNPR